MSVVHGRCFFVVMYKGKMIINRITTVSIDIKRRILAYSELLIGNELHTENKDYNIQKNVCIITDAEYGWYRYDTRFAIPRYGNEGELTGYNIFKGRLVIRHAEDGKLYLYDILRIKKETSKPPE